MSGTFWTRCENIVKIINDAIIEHCVMIINKNVFHLTKGHLHVKSLLHLGLQNKDILSSKNIWEKNWELNNVLPL